MSKVLTAEQIYKRNKKRAKVFSVLAPAVWHVFLALTFLFLYLAAENSIGNVVEILELLDKDFYSGEEVQENYARLAEQWGEWEIVGEENSAFTIRYIDVGAALFSGLLVTYITLATVALCVAIVFGKIIFPQLVQLYNNSNAEMVDLATLKSASQIDKISRKSGGKEWF